MQNPALNPPSSVPPTLPLTRSLALAYTLSLLIAVLLILASAGGLLYQDAFYPTTALQASFVANDVAVAAIMGLVCFMPFALFVRGIVAYGRAS